MSLEQAYDSIKHFLPKNSAESLEVLKQIQEYWNLWKPNLVNVLLLAESHVYTSQADFEVSYSKIKLESFIRSYPTKFVRLVYCFAYGEPDLLNESLEDNSGTTQFWKIFCACTAKTETDLAFRRVLKSETAFFSRMRNKVTILNELKRRGIWLIDASLVGIYRGIDDPEIKGKVIRASWDKYIKNLVSEAHPKDIIVIGKGVANALSWRLSNICSLINAKCTVLPQPQGNRGSSEEQMETYREYQRICSKYNISAVPFIVQEKFEYGKKVIEIVNEANEVFIYFDKSMTSIANMAGIRKRGKEPTKAQVHNLEKMAEDGELDGLSILLSECMNKMESITRKNTSIQVPDGLDETYERTSRMLSEGFNYFSYQAEYLKSSKEALTNLADASKQVFYEHVNENIAILKNLLSDLNKVINAEE